MLESDGIYNVSSSLVPVYDDCDQYAHGVPIREKQYTTYSCRIPTELLTNYSIVAKISLSENNSAVNLVNFSSDDGSRLSITLDNCAQKLHVVNQGPSCQSPFQYSFSLDEKLVAGEYYKLGLEFTTVSVAFFFECQLKQEVISTQCSLSTTCSRDTTMGLMGPPANSSCPTVSSYERKDKYSLWFVLL